MDARDILKSGDPRAALETLKQEVRKAPRDVRLRTFLFQLFCVFGEWDRALNQLKVASELDPEAIPMATTYNSLIRSEILRNKIFSGARTPTIFGPPEPWMSLLVEALRGVAAGSFDEAAKLRDQAFDEAPAVGGTIDDVPFEWVADADPRLGPMLEGIIEGKYVWIPIHRLSKLSVDEPTDLRDRVWTSVEFTWANGGTLIGFMPTRYPGSAEAADPAIALAQRTEWQEKGDWFLGLGQRMLATDAGETPLMDMRHLVIHSPAAEAAPAPDATAEDATANPEAEPDQEPASS